MGSAEKAAALSTIFGSRAVTGINILLQEGTDKLRDYRTQLEDAGGSAANIAEAMRGSIKNKIEVLKSALTELGFKFVESFKEKGVGLIEKLTDAVSNFDPQPAIDAAVTIGNVIADVIKVIWSLREPILGVSIAWGIYKTAQISAAVVTKLKILEMIKSVSTLMKTQKGMNIVQAVFNTLLKTNPVGLVITAIGLLIGLIIACEGKIQRLVGVFQLLGMVLAVVFLPALGAISPLLAPIVFFIGFIYSMIHELISSWGMLVETFKTDGIIAGLKRLGGILLSGLLMPIQGLLELLAKIPGVGKFLGPAAEQISAFRNQLKGIETETENPSKNPVESASSPATATNPAPVAPPAITTPVTGPITDTKAPAMKQPALLNLREGRLFSAGPGRRNPATAPRAASLWSVPVSQDAANFDTQAAPITQSSPPVAAASPVPASITQAPGPSGRIVPPAIANNDPAGADRLVPPVAESPIAPSVGTALIPPAPPMTRAEQMAAEQILYSKTENNETITVKISPEKGLEARVVNPPKSPNVKLEISGAV
jgi:hypothetical protein